MLKRPLTAAAAILVAAACADSPTRPSADLLPTAAAPGEGANTTVVCHMRGNSGKMSLLNINENALDAHLDQVDFQAGPATLGVDITGRVFLHTYDIDVACDGFAGTGSEAPTRVEETISGSFDGTNIDFTAVYDRADDYAFTYPGPENALGLDSGRARRPSRWT